jgi:cysteine-rich repeat protein
VLVLLAACKDDLVPDDAVCGNDILEVIEQCDDGNATSGDGCSDRCFRETLIQVDWSFYPSVDGPPLESGCSFDGETIELVTEMFTTKRYPCTAYRGQLFISVSDRLIVRLRGATDDILMESPIYTPRASRVFAKFYDDGGYIQTVVAAIPSPVTCSIQIARPDEPMPEEFECTGLPNETFLSGGLIAGQYDVTFTRPNAQPQTKRVVVGTNNAITPVSFQ